MPETQWPALRWAFAHLDQILIERRGAMIVSDHFEIVDAKGDCAGGVKFINQIDADLHLQRLGRCGRGLKVALIVEKVERIVLAVDPIALAA